jgi:hypothetical protein
LDGKKSLDAPQLPEKLEGSEPFMLSKTEEVIGGDFNEVSTLTPGFLQH